MKTKQEFIADASIAIFAALRVAPYADDDVIAEHSVDAAKDLWAELEKELEPPVVNDELQEAPLDEGSHCLYHGPDAPIGEDGCCTICGRDSHWYEGGPCRCDTFDDGPCPQCLHDKAAKK